MKAMQKLAYFLINISQWQKTLILISADMFFSVLALWLALSLRLGVWYLPQGDEWYLFTVAPFIVVSVFIRLGLYRAIIRYIEIRALMTIVQAVTLYALLFAFVLYESGIKGIPRTVPPLNWLNMLLLVSGSRFWARWWLGEVNSHLSGGRREINHLKKRNMSQEECFSFLEFFFEELKDKYKKRFLN